MTFYIPRTTWALACAVVALFACAEHTVAQESLKAASSKALKIAKYKTKHFCLHTDLSQGEAEQALAEMEASLEFAENYWREKLRGQIKCYLAQDVTIWPEEALPHPLARVWIGGIGGATISSSTKGKHPSRIQAVIYSSTLPGVLTHEVVHAYCSQTFGATGPDWYKEGMAEIAAHYVTDPEGTWFPKHLLKNLKASDLADVRSIVRGGNFTNDTARSLGVMLANRIDETRPVLMSHWDGMATKELEQMRPAYASSWALCHLLSKNPNYSTHFRRLGTRCLTKKQDNFDRMFNPVMDELNFEFQFLLDNIANGYRVDLCAWDWEKKFVTIDEKAKISRRIEAARGFQPTGLWVEAGQSYQYSTTGSWATGPEAPETDSNGDSAGWGSLVGVVLRDFKLSQPIRLGTDGSFTAPESGKLYTRCNDAWNELADNSGSIVLKLSR